MPHFFPDFTPSPKRQRISKCLLALLSFIIITTLISCAAKPKQDELNRLEDARKAAETAESELEQLKKDRLELEEKLDQQKKILEQKQKEVEDAKSKIPAKWTLSH